MGFLGDEQGTLGEFEGISLQQQGAQRRRADVLIL